MVVPMACTTAAKMVAKWVHLSAEHWAVGTAYYSAVKTVQNLVGWTAD